MPCSGPIGEDWSRHPSAHLRPFVARHLAAQAGFGDCRITTANSEFYWRQSLSLLLRSVRSNPLERGSNSLWARAIALGLAALAQSVRPFNDQSGESFIAHATRN